MLTNYQMPENVRKIQEMHLDAGFNYDLMQN